MNINLAKLGGAILDCSAIINMLKPGTQKTFAEDADAADKQKKEDVNPHIEIRKTCY